MSAECHPFVTVPPHHHVAACAHPRPLTAASLGIVTLVAATMTGCAGPDLSANTPAPPPPAYALADSQLAARDQRIAELGGQLQTEQASRQIAEAQRAQLYEQLAAARRQLQLAQASQQQAQAQAAQAQAQAAQAQAQADRLAECQTVIAKLQQRLAEVANAAPPPPPVTALPEEIASQLAGLAQRHGLIYDRRTEMLRLPGDLLFASGSDEITPQGRQVLAQVSAVLERPELTDWTVRVVGHTDRRPIVQAATRARHQTNWHLSTDRAIAVVAELIQDARTRHGNPAALDALKRRFEVVGHGQQRLLDTADTPDAHRRNRRVEISLVSPAGPGGGHLTAVGHTPHANR